MAQRWRGCPRAVYPQRGSLKEAGWIRSEAWHVCRGAGRVAHGQQKEETVFDEKTNEAFGALAEASGKSVRAVIDGAAEAQRRNLALLQGWTGDPSGFFEEQVEINQRAMRALAEQLDRQQEVMRDLFRESSRMYMGLFYAPVLLGESSRSTREERGTQEETPELPIEDYDQLNVEEIARNLDELNAAEVERIRMYERHHKNRIKVMEHLDRSLI